MDANKLLACFSQYIIRLTDRTFSLVNPTKEVVIYTRIIITFTGSATNCPNTYGYQGYAVNDTLLADQIASQPIRPRYRLRDG